MGIIHRAVHRNIPEQLSTVRQPSSRLVLDASSLFLALTATLTLFSVSPIHLSPPLRSQPKVVSPGFGLNFDWFQLLKLYIVLSVVFIEASAGIDLWHAVLNDRSNCYIVPPPPLSGVVILKLTLLILVVRLQLGSSAGRSVKIPSSGVAAAAVCRCVKQESRNTNFRLGAIHCRCLLLIYL